jgi:hypothetical protein
MPEHAFDPEDQLRRAREFAERGWRPFPVEFRGKRPHVNVGKWGTATASPAPDKMLTRWFGGQQVNIGIAAKGSGLVVIDEDRAGAFGRLAADHGQEVPLTYTVVTAKGRHYYFTAPEGYPIGNAPGVLKAYGIDVRGGGDGDGGYVVAAGSTHESGVVYTIDPDADVDAVDMPMWLVELLLPRLAPEPPASPGSDAEDSLFGDSTRRFTPAQAREYMTAYAAEPLQAARPGHRNATLNNAATVVGHFVPAFLSHQSALSRLLALAAGVGLGGAEADATARSGLARGMAEPYLRVEEASSSPDAFQAAVDTELTRLRVRQEAQRLLRREQRGERPSILSGLIDDLDAIEAPAMLLDGLIPDKAVGFLAGRSGAYKSFLAVAWAFAIATGQAWGEFKAARTLKTLYVAAEGAAGAAGRMKAWEAHTGISRAGRLLLYPKPIHLNDEDQAAELGEVLAAGEFQFLVVDTYHRSAPGTEENDATEFGVVFDAVARFRDELGVGVLFIDHTGHSTDGRPRGSSAKGDDADYVLTASYTGDTRGGDVQRTLRVIKLKDQESEGEWPIGLRNVTDDNGLARPTFPIISVVDGAEAPNMRPPDWWEGAEQIPDDLLDRMRPHTTGRKGMDAALVAYRVFAYVGPEASYTKAQLLAVINRAPDRKPPMGAAMPEPTLGYALGLLVKAGVLDRSDEKATRYTWSDSDETL